jgi:hypothetical protein
MQNTGHHYLDGKKEPEKPYEVQEFPKTMHHKTKPTVEVKTPAEQAALGSEWQQTPAAFKEGAAAEKAAAEQAAAEKAAAEKQASAPKK